MSNIKRVGTILYYFGCARRKNGPVGMKKCKYKVAIEYVWAIFITITAIECIEA